jgi:hypothetical protein
MSLSSLTDLSKRHDLNIGHVKNILKDLKPAKNGGGKGRNNGIYYLTKDADELIKVFLDIPRKPPTGCVAKANALKSVKNLASSTFYQLMQQPDAPKPAGVYWNGQKLVPYYKLDELQTFFSLFKKRPRPSKVDESDNETTWPIPEPPYVAPMMQALIRSRWINP